MKHSAYILRLALTLLIITGVMAALLAGVNAITEDKIAAITAEKTRQAIAAVLEDAAEAKPVEYADETGMVSALYQSSSGFAVQVTPLGFDGEITMMVGVSYGGKVLGISVISHTETAGLGAVAGADNARGQAFRQQFVGLGGSQAVSKDGGRIDALTGATITSRAVVEGVNAAVACVENLVKGG